MSRKNVELVEYKEFDLNKNFIEEIARLIFSYFKFLELAQFFKISKSWKNILIEIVTEMANQQLAVLYSKNKILTKVIPNKNCNALAIYKAQVLSLKKIKDELKASRGLKTRKEIAEPFKYAWVIKAIAQGLLSLDMAAEITSDHDILLKAKRYPLEEIVKFKPWQASGLRMGLYEHVALHPEFSLLDDLAITLLKLKYKENNSLLLKEQIFALSLSQIKNKEFPNENDEDETKQVQFNPIRKIEPNPIKFKIEDFFYFILSFCDPLEISCCEAVSKNWHNNMISNFYWEMLILFYRKDQQKEMRFCTPVLPEQKADARALYRAQIEIEQVFAALCQQGSSEKIAEQDSIIFQHVRLILMLDWVVLAIANGSLPIDKAVDLNLAYDALVKRGTCTVAEVIRLTPFEVKKLHAGFSKTVARDPLFTREIYAAFPWQAITNPEEVLPQLDLSQIKRLMSGCPLKKVLEKSISKIEIIDDKKSDKQGDRLSYPSATPQVRLNSTPAFVPELPQSNQVAYDTFNEYNM